MQRGQSAYLLQLSASLGSASSTDSCLNQSHHLPRAAHICRLSKRTLQSSELAGALLGLCTVHFLLQPNSVSFSSFPRCWYLINSISACAYEEPTWNDTTCWQGQEKCLYWSRDPPAWTRRQGIKWDWQQADEEERGVWEMELLVIALNFS